MNITPRTKSRIKMVLGLMLIALIGLGLTNCIRKRRPPRGGDQRPPSEVATIVGRDYDETEVFNFLHPVDTRGLSTEVPLPDERWGNSEPLDYSPLEGFHITAERDAFKENTVVEVTPLTTLTKTTLNAMDNIESQGFIVIDGYEVNAGLEDDEIMPGEYTVTIDLDVLDIDPSLYPNLTAFRVADDGSYYEYATQINDGKLAYRSNQNSALMIGVAIAIAYTAISNIEYYGSLTYFITNSMSSCRRQFGDVTYQIYWHMYDIDVNKYFMELRLKEIEQKYKDMKDELYKKYLRENGFENTSPLYRFFNAKRVAQVVQQAIDNDEEYQQIKKELELPKVVEEAIQRIDEAFTYLKENEYVKMPTGVVQIISHKLDDGELGNATSRTYNESYVEIDLAQLKKGSQIDKNDFLMTMTHELLHVCQQKYRASWADSNRYDEIVAVYMEGDALEHYIAYERIKKNEVPILSETSYWTTLKLPIDKYDKIYDSKVMRHEGYNLGLFVKYLKKKKDVIMYAGKLMRARSYYKEGGASKPLMTAFDITEAEFDIFYRGFIKENKHKIASHYNHRKNQKLEQYQRNDEKVIAKGKKYPVPVKVLGSYSSEIHGFTQPDTDPMHLVVVPDEGFAQARPECNLIPVDPFEFIPKGFYIPPVDPEKLEKSQNNRDILEIHGALGNASTSATTGFTLYVWGKTRRPQAKEDDEHLIIKMPKNSFMADDGIVDGYELTIEAENGKELHKVIMPTFFEKEVKIDKRELYGRTGRKKDLRVKITLCEFIRMKDNSRLRGEESYVREFTLSGYNRAENTGYGEPDEPEEPDEPGDIDEGDEPNVKYCWQLVETKVESKPHESSEIGSGCSYSASAGSHLKKGVHIGNDYEGHRYAFSATIQAPPARIEGGQTLILHATLQNTEGTEGYIFEEALLSFEDESIPMGFTNGSIGKVTKLKGSTKVIIGGDSSGSWDYEIRIPAGSEGSRKALNFFSCGSRTHWVYEWKEVSD